MLRLSGRVFEPQKWWPPLLNTPVWAAAHSNSGTASASPNALA